MEARSGRVMRRSSSRSRRRPLPAPPFRVDLALAPPPRSRMGRPPWLRGVAALLAAAVALAIVIAVAFALAT